MMMTAILKAPQKLVIEKMTEPECPSGGILIEVKACSICTTDAKMFYYGQRDLIYPRILGHEVTGVIVENKMGDPSFKIGDRVQIAPGISCGRCAFCQKGATNKCDQIGIFGFTHHGGFAQFLSVPPESIRCKGVNIIPDKLTFEQATLAEPLACCLNGQERVGLDSGDTVLIFGAGPIGCLHAMAARTKGVSRIFLVERLQTRIEMARAVKADLLIDASENIEPIIKRETKNRGVDVIIFACSEFPTDYPITDILAPRGRVCFFSGLPPEKTQIQFNGNTLHYNEMAFVGAYGCTSYQNKMALDLIASGEVSVDWLITKRISLAQVREGIEYVAERRGMKVTITEF